MRVLTYCILIYLVIANAFIFYFIYSISDFDRAFAYPFEENKIRYFISWMIYTALYNAYALIPVALIAVLLIVIRKTK